MQREFFWPHIANDVYKTISTCSTCAWNSALPKLIKELQLLPTNGPLKFVAIDILGPLPRTRNENQYVIVMTDKYSKLTRAMQTGKTSSSHFGNVSFDSQVVLYFTPVYVQLKHGVKFNSKMFSALGTMLDVKHQTTTAFHPQTNEQVKRYNLTIVKQLRNYVAENQKYLDTYVQRLT